ncbi:MAG: M1 family metallopeptidase [Saprospiraceae bacterium]
MIKLVKAFTAAIFLLLTFVLPAVALAQQDYFQQQTDYTLNAKLDPSSHVLTVAGTLTYTNNSTDALDSIPLQLWANAYSNRKSAYANQKRRLGDATFAFAKEEDLGGYIDIKVAGPSVKRTYQPESELLWVVLAKAVEPGEKTLLTLSYTLKVPKSFSRMGREKTSYQITQWYPKPALYNRDGWNIMPYLDFGEYFNDFGDYEVSISIPQNGIVAATGIPSDEVTQSLLNDRITLSASNPEAVDALDYGAELSTFSFTAAGVSDFAWFADSKFLIDTAEVKLLDENITAFTYYGYPEAERWDSSALNLARAVHFADSLVGSYPHAQVSAVSAPLGVGGGMEYPMITVIGGTSSNKELDRVLAHEAFHNWFALDVATNERTHAWMDEGLTSYVENRYMEQYYEGNNRLSDQMPQFIAKGSPHTGNSIFHGGLASAHRHDVPDTHSNSLSSIGYGYAAYSQPQLLFDLLDAYLGGDEFESRLQSYYQEWSGKHPSPADLQTSLGGEPIDWLFDDLLMDNKLPNYKIEEVVAEGESISVVITNKGDVASPLALSFEDETGYYGKVIWKPGFIGTQTIELIAPSSAYRIAIDPELLTPEVRRNDNYYRLSGPTPKLEPLSVNLVGSIGDPAKNTLNVIPALSFNSADKLLLGFGFHNYQPVMPETRYYLLPMISTRDASLNGIGSLAHSFYKSDSWYREIELAVDARSFHYNYNEAYDFNDRFTRITAGATVFLKARGGLPVDNSLSVRVHNIDQLYARGRDIATRTFTKETKSYQIVELGFSSKKKDPIKPVSYNLDLQAGKEFSRLSGVFNYGVRYSEKSRFIRLRAFAGTFLNRGQPEQNAFLLPTGITGFLANQYDYTFTEEIINRSGGGNQIFVRDGSLTLPFLLPVPFSDSWLTSVSATADLPVGIPVLGFSAYLDAALYPDTRSGQSGTVLPLTGGFRISLPGNIFHVSFPVMNSAFVKEALPFTIAEPNYWDRVSFSLDLNPANIDALLRSIRG